MNMFIKWAPYYYFAMLMCCAHTQEICPDQAAPYCSSCVNDTAICNGRCIGGTMVYMTQICTGHEHVIQNVDLSNNSLNHLDCTSTASIKLRILNISVNNITIDNCIYWKTNCLTALNHLEYIDLSFNKINNSCNTSFSLRRLKHVNLSHNQITSLRNLPFFSEAIYIQVADLSHNQISHLPCDLLQNKPKLISLNISFNNFGKFWICQELQPEPRGIFDYHIFYMSSSDLNGTIFDYETHQTSSFVLLCVLSINDVSYNSSLCYDDIFSSVTRQERSLQGTIGNETDKLSQNSSCKFTFHTPCSEEGIKTMMTTQLPEITTTEGSSSKYPTNTVRTSFTSKKDTEERKSSPTTETSISKFSKNTKERTFTETLLYMVILCSFGVILITCSFSVYVVRKLSHIASQPLPSNMKSFEYSKQALDTSDRPPKLPRRSFLKKLKMKYRWNKEKRLLSPTNNESFNLNKLRPLPNFPTNESPGVDNTSRHGALDVGFSQKDENSSEERSINDLNTNVDLADKESTFDSWESPFCKRRSKSFYYEFSKSSIKKKTSARENVLETQNADKLTNSLSYENGFINNEGNDSIKCGECGDKLMKNESINLSDSVNLTRSQLGENRSDEPNVENADLTDFSLKNFSTMDTMEGSRNGQVGNAVVVDVEVHPNLKVNGAVC